MSYLDEYKKALEEARKKEEEKKKQAEKEAARIKAEAEKRKASTKKNSDIAPGGRTWFQRGGETVADKILGTSTDVGTDLTSGIVGLGEKIVDWAAGLAPAAAKTMYYQNGGGFNIEADKAFEESNKKFEEDMIAPFVAKDLYDEQKVAKAILSNLYGGADNFQKLQGGQMLTEEELIAQQQKQKEMLQYMDESMEADSVLGDKSDSLIQSAGQLLGTSALAMAGVPWYLTTGASTWGAESENALKQGATLGEANLSGMISAGAEILTEKISGGIKIPGLGKTADDAIINTLAANISNKTVRTLAKLGVDMVGEGAEEVLSGVLSAIGQKLTYADDKAFNELFSTEDALESFIGGMVLGGGGSVTSAAHSSLSGVDSVSGLTNDEYKVAQKQLEKFSEGKELAAKEKADEWKKITEKMEKGYISAEDVEEALGGEAYENFRGEWDKFRSSEDYKAYSDVNKKLEALKTEHDTIGAKTEATLIEKARFDDIRNEMSELETKRGELDKTLSQEADRIRGIRDQMRSQVMEKVKDTKLAESYQELARKQQKFEVDVNQYEGKARETVQKIIDSGLGDNTNQFHDAVDFLAKISKDKDVTFDFTNNERIKGTEHHQEGYVTNGYVNDNGDVVLNMDSKNAMHTIVGHEVTHVLEKADGYTALQSAVRDYCIAKEGLEKYNARIKTAEEAYKGKKNTTPEGEVTADLIGEYIFNDPDFVKQLSTDDRTTFEKIYDEIKYLFKVAVSGSKEKRELEKVKKIFDDVWRENVKGKSEEDGATQYSLTKDSNGKELTAEQAEFFKDSKVRDENGNLMPMYHGTKKGGFTVFDGGKDYWYFTNSKEYANSFEGRQANGELYPIVKEGVEEGYYNPQQYEVYLNVKNPFITDDIDIIEDALYWDKTLPSKLREQGYDALMLEDMSQVIVLNQNQIKNTDNANPTADPDIRFSLSPEDAEPGYGYVPSRDIGANDPLDDFAPIREDVSENIAPDVETEEHPIKTTKEKLNEKLTNRQNELEKIEKLRAEASKTYDEKIAKAQAQLDSKKNKDSKVANTIKMRIERLQRLKADIDAKYAKRIRDITKSIDKTNEELEKDHTEKDRYAKAKERINRILASDKAALVEEYAQRKADLESKTSDKEAYISNKARELYDELRNLRKGVRASEELGSLLDAGLDWGNLRSALSSVRYNPSGRVNESSVEESAVRQLINEAYENDVYGIDDLDVELAEKISKLEAKAEDEKDSARRATQRRTKNEQYNTEIREMIGDTSTWVDLPIGLLYKTKTLRRILRSVVRDANGKPDIQKADKIYDYIETAYDHNEASLKKESAELKNPFAKLELTSKEDVYAQMLGELRYNPETTLTEDVVKEYYEKHKKKINPEKVNKAIEEARKLYDDLFERLNAALREQGFKEIPYRKGYFPHFTNPKQTWWMKALNWKPVDNEIPTSIAGLTETFKPQRSWQSFNQQRRGDQTDYSLYKGLDTYVHGALDWVYHIEDLQKRRALENHLRYIHSDEGIQKRIDEIKNSNLDAEEAQAQIDAVLKEGRNPLGGLVRELMNRTNTLANKKAAADRAMEDDANRKIYSTLTNLNNRVNANMVVGSFSSALTNFIPMVQSWHEVSPYYTVSGLRDMVRSTIKDDGMVQKSDFLTNRLMNEENLYKTGWDKVSDKAAIIMSVFDNITAQTVWRSKYLQNLSENMSESEAIKNADQFAKNLMAGRSRGNAPTIFDAKNPRTKLFTAFQLEVANQYGYMFDDVVKDSTSKARLVKGYATAFMGAYLYNALYSTLVGRDVAFDPISIIEDLMRGLFDDEEENEDVLMGFGEDILQNVPFVGGLLGGGRVPIQSALPYANDSTPFASVLTDVSEGNWGSIGKELLKPLYYLAMPVGGGQIKKTVEGLGMYLSDHPIDGSYTDAGKLRFPVEDDFLSVAQAALFGQYSSKNARDYFDNDWAPLGENQIQEYTDLDMAIEQYQRIREDLKDFKTNAEKVDYIGNLDITDEQKNILVNNILDRKDPVDMTSYGEYGSYEEFDFAQKNPSKYAISKMYGYDQYMAYTDNISKISGTKDSNGKTISGSRKSKVAAYINSLPLSKEEKMLLFKAEYPADDTYNMDILKWLDSQDIPFDEVKTILEELGFKVYNGTVTWD